MTTCNMGSYSAMSTTIREPTTLGVYELSGGVVTNASTRSPFVLGIGRGRGEFIQTGGEFVSNAKEARAYAIFGFSWCCSGSFSFCIGSYGDHIR